MKTITYFDNYDMSQYEEMAKEYLEESGDGYNSDDIYNLANLYEQEDVEWVEAEMNRIFDGKTLIATGFVGLWTGRHDGGDIYKSWSEFIQKFGKDCDYFNIYAESGHFYVRCSHHDGTNLCEVKVLTDRGERYFENWNYGLDARTDKYSISEVMRRLFTNSKYSRLPQLA